MRGPSAGGLDEPEMGQGKLALAGEGRGHSQTSDPPVAGPNQRADLEQSQADHATRGLSELGVGKADAARDADRT